MLVAMAYFPDLSPYLYFSDDLRAKNVGWLNCGERFDTAPPSEDMLDLLWDFCFSAPIVSRGCHSCDLCATPQTIHASRNGVTLLLGTSEIIVFARESDTAVLRRRLGEAESGGLFFFRGSKFPFSVFVAPTLIYHYVEVHHYKPPDDFVQALKEGPRPPDREYFDLAKKLDLEPR
jgi:hypothetical protein